MLNLSTLKSWFLKHQNITGSIVGLFVGLIGTLHPSFPLFLIAPLIAGLVSGFLKGSGAKAGFLTLIFPVVAILFVSLVTPNLDWTATERPVVTGIGPINATFAALTNGILSSTWGIASGFAALTSALGGILSILILILIPVMIAMTLGATLISGLVGGLIGKFIRNRFVALA
jgi:F0F1-type ATP synthase assembly protein I